MSLFIRLKNSLLESLPIRQVIVFFILTLLTFVLNYYGLRYGVIFPDLVVNHAMGLVLPNTDVTVDMDYARAVYESKSFFPDGTYFTTEPRALLPALVTALFYGCFGSLGLATALSITVLSTLVLLCVYQLLLIVDTERRSALWGTAAFSFLYVDALWTFNNFGSFYVQLFLGTMMTLIAFFSKRHIWYILSVPLAFLMGLQSPRAVVLLYVPLLILSSINKNSKEGRNQPLFLMGLLIVHCAGYLCLRGILVPHYHLSMDGPQAFRIIPDVKFLTEVARNLLECVVPFFGLWWQLNVFYIFLFLCAMGVAVLFITQWQIKEKQKYLLLFCLLSGGGMIVSSIIIHASAARYYLPFLWAVIFLLTFGLEQLMLSWGKIVLYGGIGVLLIGFFLWQGQKELLQMDWKRTAQEYRAVHLVEQVRANYVYATYWHNGPLECASGYRIRTGNLIGGAKEHPGDVSLAPYLFGTNRKLYEKDTAQQHVVLILDSEELSHLNENGKRIVAQGEFLGTEGNLFLWLFEENPFLIGKDF